MMFLYLIVAHFLCDYPLQGNYMAMAKNRHLYDKEPFKGDEPFEDKYDGFSVQRWKEWFWVLSGHAIIHGGAVALITGIWWLGVLETIAHWLIDDAKCGGKLSYNQDQVLHIACKVVWFGAAFAPLST